MKFDAQGNSKPDIYDHFTNERKKNDELEKRIAELEAALIPLVNAWRYVSSHHSELVKNANLEEHYFWKPSSTAEQIPGLSWADAKRAHDLLNPTLPTPSPWDNDASAAELPY